MAWAYVNIALGLVLSLFGAYLIGGYGDRFNWMEKGGIGLQAAGMVLSIGPILSRNDLLVDNSPFDDWSGALFRLGGALALAGIIARLEGFSPASRLAVGSGEGRIGKWRHKRRNEAQKRIAEAELRARGKL